MLTVES
jgi:small subunit ribosomal protein S7e